MDYSDETDQICQNIKRKEKFFSSKRNNCEFTRNKEEEEAEKDFESKIS